MLLLSLFQIDYLKTAEPAGFKPMDEKSPPSAQKSAAHSLKSSGTIEIVLRVALHPKSLVIRLQQM
jgi:hypothetical protein